MKKFFAEYCMKCSHENPLAHLQDPLILYCNASSYCSHSCLPVIGDGPIVTHDSVVDQPYFIICDLTSQWPVIPAPVGYPCNH